ncbi:hypothetical protein BDV96DRAFT_584596 [Lophiotrema nucula]|uniref:Uncharacterized protein n=1 Tax=Lophiotrema nucula TaxID=690887 RepID=A0A6A5YSQ5_9PLEO|nr:hypothetical protein BDV96DRAFT_584596 [Lophiotrema nucula]
MDANAPPAGHKRSQSLLSAISSAVSAERLPVSPASSQVARSRPPSSHRQLQGSPAKNPVIPAPTLAEPAPKEQKSLATARDDDDDYDLYADHNGIVKDVHDEKGQPLKVASAQVPNGIPAVHPPVPGPTQNQHAMPLPEEEARRYSDERPMSFVWGPRDANGRPQDQINKPTPTPSETNIPVVPPIPNHLQEQYQDSPVDPTYIPVPQQSKQQRFEGHQPQPQTHLQPQKVDKSVGLQNVSPLQNSVQPQQVGSPSQSNVSSSMPSNASPPPQPTPPPGLAQRSLLQGPELPNGQHHDPRMQEPRMLQDSKMQDPRLPDPRLQDSRLQDPKLQDPRLQDPRLQDPRLQDPKLQDPRLQDPRLQDPRVQDPRLMADPRMQDLASRQPYPQDPRMQTHSPQQALSQDPRFQGQPGVPPQGPRNQYELQQQMMQRKAMDPRLRNPEYRLPGVSAPQAINANSLPALQQEPKSSSRPKLGSVFKGLGGKSSPAAQQPTKPPNDRINPTLTAPEDPNRSTSYQSSLGDLPTDQVAAKKKERKTSVFGSLSNRPQSVGTESHISQDSTRVQAADSRLDLRYPASPAPFKGIPPHQPPPGAPASQGQPQPHRASTSAVPESSKKKRFSAISSLFSRSSSTDAVVSSKPPKLSKEVKKAQKAQRHKAAPTIQPPPAQQWPQNPQFRQQPPLGPLQAHAARPFPGMQVGGPQTLSPQAMTPGYQGFPPNGMPQQYIQSPGFPQQHMQQQQRQGPNGSAYLDTRQIALERQQQASSQISPQPNIQQRPNIPRPSASQDRVAQRPEDRSHGPPPGGYYTPDSKRPLSEQDARTPAPADQRQPTLTAQPLSNARRISSLNSPQEQVRQPISQRHVSAPLREPKYDTPQIPAAYNHVSGAYVSPGAEIPAYNFPLTPPQPQQIQHPVNGHPQHPQHPMYTQHHQDPREQYSGPQSRQYSDPQMQPLSPQISEQSLATGQRTHSESSVQSIVSPVSNPSPGMPNSLPAPNQRTPKPRMSSISEATQHDERPWNVNLPEGATEQEIVRARHQQYMVQQIAAQQQLNAERHAKSPSPNPSRHTQSPSPQPAAQQQALPTQPSAVQGFREVLPRGSPQPYPVSQVQQNQPMPAHLEDREDPSPRSRSPQTAQPLQPAPIHPDQVPNGPAAYPLPTSPDSAKPSAKSPVNPLAAALPPPPPPPPKIPHSPMRPVFPVDQAVTTDIYPPTRQETQQNQPRSQEEVYQPLLKETGQDYSTPREEQSYERPPRDPPPQEPQYPTPREEQSYERPPRGPPPPEEQPHYEQQPPDEPPPSYDGPGVANEGMDKSPQAGPSPQGRHRPPNIMTDADLRGREREIRQRQASIGLLQHPQPASMAASPQRTSADMGADILRRQLYHQDERDRVERIQRAEIQRMTSEQERQERERARARARELERSVSGGGRVTSLRSVGGSGNGRQPGWERRGSASRPVYELPAEEDDEPVMRATSFPGQEWVPTWTED